MYFIAKVYRKRSEKTSSYDASFLAKTYMFRRIFEKQVKREGFMLETKDVIYYYKPQKGLKEKKMQWVY